MTKKRITRATVKSHIRKCIRNKQPISFLGLVENQDLSPQVVALFSRGGWYNWVSGNERMQDLIKKIKEEEEN
jgi:hypothetical protein